MSENKFGFNKESGIQEQYIGKWVIIYPPGINKTFSGYCKDVREGYALLNPFGGEGSLKEIWRGC